MDKRHILEEIRRTAEQNGGVALGKVRFEKETGIKESDWSGRFWTRWGDAVSEAGFLPNVMQQAHDDADVLEKLANFVDELGRYPTVPELKLKRRNDQNFPSKGRIAKLGYRSECAKKIAKHCEGRKEFRKVLKVCRTVATEPIPKKQERIKSTDTRASGYVYLMKSGKHYKIGFTNSLDRRKYEIGMQLPHGIEPIHSIRTDDPAGIEAYWHRRFKDKHMNGEWFDLSPQDVAAFKRRKFM